MLRTVLFSLCSLVLISCLVSCKKDKAKNQNYYVKLLKDGSWINWSTAEGEMGPDNLDPTRVNLVIGGASDNGSDQFYIYLQRDGSTFGTGTFDSDDQSVVTQDWTYISGLLGSDPKYHSPGTIGTEDSHFIINITSVTDEAIEGNFTGNFLITMDESSTVNITQGEFRVMRID